MSGTPGYMRWQPSEYLKVAVAALPLVDKGKSITDAFFAAQRRALPKDRRREADDLRKMQYSGAPQKYIDQARALSETERAALLPPPPPPRKAPPKRVKLDEGRDYSANGTIRWTGREKALIARRVSYWLEHGDTRVLSRLIVEAQEIELEPDRRRSIPSIQSGTTGGHNKKTIEEGLRLVWQIENIPFKPDAQDAAAAEAETTAAPATDVADNAEDEAQRIGAMAFNDPAQAADARAAKAASEAPNPVQATTPAPAAERALSDAARAFGDTVMQALDKLLATHAEIMLGKVQAKLNEQAQTTAASIAAMIERGMRETVHKIVEVELGGPVAAPATVASAPAAPEAAHAPQLKVDVFTFPDAVLQDKVQREVRATFNGSTDLRFVNPDTRNYTPSRERHCIMLTQRIPRALANSFTAIGIEPLYIKATPSHVVHAIEELHRASGAGL